MEGGRLLLDQDLLRAYITDSWGYGNPKGEFWFVGMEQGGGTSVEELHRRLAAWNERGRAQFDDLHEYHVAIGELRWSAPKPRIQPTWRHLIRIVLAANGDETSQEAIRKYQSEELGRRFGNTCLLELLPLPSRNTKNWPYYEWTGLCEMKDRETYLTNAGGTREVGLRELIDYYAPRAVVFYGTTYKERWQRIVQAPFKDIGIKDVACTHRRSVLCFTVPHPQAHGVSGPLFECVGRFITEKRTH